MGGALLALGLFTPFGAALIVATMVAAVATAHRGKGPWNADGGWELNVTYAVVAVALAGAGAGAWSLDAAFDLEPRRHRLGARRARRGSARRPRRRGCRVA